MKGKEAYQIMVIKQLIEIINKKDGKIVELLKRLNFADLSKEEQEKVIIYNVGESFN